MGDKPVHFAGLNTLRFFAAFSIVICHCFQRLQPHFSPPIAMFLHNLPLGVDMFFLISGFLIVYLLLEEKDRTHKISLLNFYIRRALRIFPLYFLIVGIAYFQYHESIPTIDFKPFLYFAGNFWLIQNKSWSVEILNPLWSISIEEHFYLIIPILVSIIPLKRIHWLFFLIIIGSFSFRFYAAYFITDYWMTLYCHTFSRCDALAIGGLLAYYYKNDYLKIKIPKIQIYAATLLLILWMMTIDTGDFSTPAKAVFLKLLFIIPLIFLFIGIVLNGAPDSGFVWWIKNNQVLNYLGKVSFGIYMFNSPIGDYFGQLEAFRNPFMRIPVIIFSTILVSILSYELIEKRILKLKTRFEVIKSINKI